MPRQTHERAATMLPALPSPLDYAPPPSRRSRWGRRLMVGAVVILCVIIVWKLSIPAWRQMRLSYWQKQCMQYQPSSNVVISPSTPIPNVPTAWRQFYNLLSPPGGTENVTLFLHECVSPAGNRRLIEFGGLLRKTKPGMEIYDASLQPIVRVIKPGSYFSSPKEIITAKLSGTAAQYFHLHPNVVVDAGQLDPSDPSHFIVHAHQPFQEITIDGWLDDHDNVELDMKINPTTPATGNGNGGRQIPNQAR